MINSGAVNSSAVNSGASNVIQAPQTDGLSFTIEHQTPSFSGLLTVNLQHKKANDGTLSIPLSHTLYDQPIGSDHTTNANIVIDGVDMSAKMTGTINIVMKEGAARIATFDLLPDAGVIDPYDWIGKQVVINYNTIRVFTGLVHAPTFNHTTAIVSFKCSDALQETVEQLSKGQVDQVVGGYWDESVFVKFREGWSYSQQRLSTIPVEYDLDVFRIQRITPWIPKNTVDFSFDSSNVLYNSSNSKLAERRSIINTIELEFNVNYNKPHQRNSAQTWRMPTTFGGWLVKPYDLPKKSDILSSLNGRTISSISFGSLPTSNGLYNATNTVDTFGFVANEFTAGVATSVSFTDSMRWLQNVKKKHLITLKAPASIKKHGELKVKRSVTVSFKNNTDWEYTGARINTNPLGLFDPSPIIPSALIDYSNAINTILNRSKTEMLASHRQNSVTFDTPLNPLLDVDLTCSIDIARVNSTGKISNLVHNFDTKTARAVSTVTISCYKPNEAGQVSDSLIIDGSTTEPVAPQNNSNLPIGILPVSGLTTHIGGEINSLPEQKDWLGWTTNYVDTRPKEQLELPTAIPRIYYSNTWRVNFKGVDDEDRKNKQWSQDNVINVAIPQNNLTLLS